MRLNVFDGWDRMNWNLRDAVELLWRGERSLDALCAAVPARDTGSRLVVGYILASGAGKAFKELKIKPSNLRLL